MMRFCLAAVACLARGQAKRVVGEKGQKAGAAALEPPGMGTAAATVQAGVGFASLLEADLGSASAIESDVGTSMGEELIPPVALSGRMAKPWGQPAPSLPNSLTNFLESNSLTKFLESQLSTLEDKKKALSLNVDDLGPVSMGDDEFNELIDDKMQMGNDIVANLENQIEILKMKPVSELTPSEFVKIQLLTVLILREEVEFLEDEEALLGRKLLKLRSQLTKDRDTESENHKDVLGKVRQLEKDILNNSEDLVANLGKILQVLEEPVLDTELMTTLQDKMDHLKIKVEIGKAWQEKIKEGLGSQE